MNIWTTKIYTKSGLVRTDVLEGARALDVGCGQRKLPGTLGMDILKNSSADIVHDMSKIPWPFKPGEFDIIFANQVLEHAENPLSILEEIHRVSKNGARVIIQVPYFRSFDAFTDLTHRHFFTSSSLDYVITGLPLAAYQYVSFRFNKIGFWYGWPQLSDNPFVRVFKFFIHRYPRFYDQYLSLLFPVACLTWELETVK